MGFGIVLWLVLAFVGGVVLAGLFYHNRLRRARDENSFISAELSSLRMRSEQLEGMLLEKESKLQELLVQKAKLEERLELQKENLVRQEEFIEKVKEHFKDSFRTLATDALKENSTEFLQRAKQLLEGIVAEGKGELGKHKEAISAVINPLKEVLEQYRRKLEETEKFTSQSYGDLKGHLSQLSQVCRQLKEGTDKLSTALRSPQVAGRWGELTLRRTVELAGLSQHCDFDEQTSTGGSRLRPDLVVHLPGGRKIAIDSKVSLSSYLDAKDSEDEQKRREYLQIYVSSIRSHIKNLSSKEYWRQFDNDSLDYVVLFLPGEGFLAAALEADKEIFEYALERKVLIASPITLIAILRTVAISWREEKLAENARRISVLGEELYKRIFTIIKHVEELGSALNNAVEKYNNFVGSLERRFLPYARRFFHYGIKAKDRLPDELRNIDNLPKLPRITETDRGEDKDTGKVGDEKTK